MARRWRTACTAAIAVGALAALVPGTSSAATNLLPNPGFESSVLEPEPVPRYTQPQAVLPEGWVFEGAAGLFDHYLKDNGGRAVHGGQRAVAVSDPASGPRRQCVDQAETCVDNPAVDVWAEARPAYSVTPMWRTALPVEVSGGSSYTLSVWTAHELATQGEGAVTFVRWLDENGAPLSVSAGPKRAAGPGEPDNFWKQISSTVRAPADAASAVVLLGHSDDLWIGQVRFDDAFFGLAS